MKVVLDRKAFEFNWSVVECGTVIYIREIQYEVTHEATISKNGAEWLAKKLLDAADLWCRGHVLQGTRWVDSMGILDLKTDYSEMGYCIKAEIWSPSDNRMVCMCFPQESSCRGWHEVGETLLAFISGHNVTEMRQSGVHEIAVPAAVNETDLFPGTSQTAGVLGQLDQSRDQTTHINEMDQTLDLDVTQGIDDSPNAGARNEAGQADLDHNLLDLNQEAGQVDFMLPDLNEPVLGADLYETSATGVATELEYINKQQTGQVDFMVPDLNEPIPSVELCQASPTVVATDLQSILNATDLDSSSLGKGSCAYSKDCFRGSTSGIGKTEKDTEWSRWKDGNIQTYRRTRGGRNDEKDRNVMFPALIKQQTGQVGSMAPDLNASILSVNLCGASPTGVATDLDSSLGKGSCALKFDASSTDCFEGSSSGTDKTEKETEFSCWKDGNIQTYRRTRRGRNNDEIRNVMFPTLIKQ